MRSIEQAFGSGGSLGSSGYGSHGYRPEAYGAQALRQRPVRLTRRGRLVIVLATLLVLVVAGFTLGRASSQAAGPQRPLPTVTVQPGQTLWQIAARVAPHADRRATIATIEGLNGLRDGHVVPGQRLRLPR